jgi:hypothetical protein
MSIMFNTLLREVATTLTDVRLIRYKDKRATTGRGPYELWRDDRPQFEICQSRQDIKRRGAYCPILGGFSRKHGRRDEVWWTLRG